MADLKTSRDQLQRAKNWLHWCDRCSLLLCCDDVPAMQRRIEVITNSNGKTFYLWQDYEEYLRLEPWPFKTDLVAVCWEERVLRQLSFSDDKALRTALDAADVSIRTMTFKK